MERDIEIRIHDHVRFWLERTGRVPSWIALGPKAWGALVFAITQHAAKTFSSVPVDEEFKHTYMVICGSRFRVQLEEELDDTDIICVP